MSEFKGFKVGQVYKVHDKTGSGIKNDYVFVRTAQNPSRVLAAGEDWEEYHLIDNWVEDGKIELVFDPDETSQTEALQELKKEYNIGTCVTSNPASIFEVWADQENVTVSFDVKHKEIIHDKKEKGSLVLCSADDFDKTLVMMLCLRQKLRDRGHL